MSTRNVRVEHGHHPRDDRPVVWITTPYDEDFADALKLSFPIRDRGWSPDDGAWWVSAEHAERAIAITIANFGETIVVDEDGAEEYRTADGVQARQERLL